MKTLSLKQPWAELILTGKKTIEIRTWNTKFRGEFLIHTSGNLDKEAMQKHNFKNLPRQAIVGKATLKQVKKYENEQEFMKDKDKHRATWEWGNYGFILEKVQRLPVKENVKGKLGFWNYEES